MPNMQVLYTICCIVSTNSVYLLHNKVDAGLNNEFSARINDKIDRIF